MNNNTYTDLVKQTFNFPQTDFEVGDDGYLEFNGVDLKNLIDKYGTPMKLTYLPKIGMQIKKAKKMFADAIKRHRYEGKYRFQGLSLEVPPVIHSPASSEAQDSLVEIFHSYLCEKCRRGRLQQPSGIPLPTAGELLLLVCAL